MKGYRFYLEHESAKDKRAGKHNGNCFAVLLGQVGRPLRQSDPAMVREVHPNLFRYLDRGGQ